MSSAETDWEEKCVEAMTELNTTLIKFTQYANSSKAIQASMKDELQDMRKKICRMDNFIKELRVTQTVYLVGVVPSLVLH